MQFNDICIACVRDVKVIRISVINESKTMKSPQIKCESKIYRTGNKPSLMSTQVQALFVVNSMSHAEHGVSKVTLSSIWDFSEQGMHDRL